MFDRYIDLSYKWTAVSSKDNPPILSGKPAHGGVALFWKISIDDFVTPLENIDSAVSLESVVISLIVTLYSY